MRLYVGNLAWDAKEGDLFAAFGKCGKVDTVTIVKDRETGKSRGFAFVDMPVDREAEKAIREIDNQLICERRVKVNEAKPRGSR